MDVAVSTVYTFYQMCRSLVSSRKFGGFYLGSIGGAAARLGKECITKVEVLEYPELGMEDVCRITVKDFPPFILTDDKGNDFYEMINRKH